MSLVDRHLLRLHAAPFGLTLAGLTTLMLAQQITKQLPGMHDGGAPSGEIVEVFALSVPFIVAVTLPMAVLVAVLWVFTRLEADTEIGGRRWGGFTMLRLVAPVLVAATCVAGAGFLWNDRLLPVANHRLRILQDHIAHRTALADDDYKSDREMSTSELRVAVHNARDDAARAERDGRDAIAHAARRREATYDVELQKKYAISAAPLVFAVFGAAVGLRFQRPRGVALVMGVSTGTFAWYYVSLIGGEELANRLIVSPVFAMWSLSLLLVVVGLLVLWRVMRRGWGGNPPVPAGRP